MSTKPSLPPRWKRFVSTYGKNRAYWYAPKGLAVTPQSIKDRLRVLEKFEHGEAWRDVQSEYIDALREAKISDAEKEWQQGGAPLARMLKQVFMVLGLAWVDEDDHIEITEAGRRVLKHDAEDVLSAQLLRYQFWNPTIRSKEHEAIQVHPVAFVCEVLRTLSPSLITAGEYTLFVSTARSHKQIDQVVALIEEFRALPPDQQRELERQCNSYMIGGMGRTSMFNTIRLNRSYALSLLTLSKYLDRNDEGAIRFAEGGLRGSRQFLEQYAATGAYIAFESPQDWIAFIGDPDVEPTQEEALAYYISKGNVAAAVGVKKAQRASTNEIRQFRKMMVSEKQVEDYLEKNLHEIGQHLKTELKLVGRQYSTTVGPIDLLAKTKGGQYAVIELKKGRSADRVFGQTSRYMGWVRKNLADDKEVIGVIVAAEIDDKLQAARAAHNTKVHLIKFEMKFGSKAV